MVRRAWDDRPVGGLYLERAASHLESIDFGEHYPPVRAPRVRIATGAMIGAATIVLTVMLPQRPRARAADRPPHHSCTGGPGRLHRLLPSKGCLPELPQDLEELLTAIENEQLASLQPGRCRVAEHVEDAAVDQGSESASGTGTRPGIPGPHPARRHGGDEGPGRSRRSAMRSKASSADIRDGRS